MVLELSVICYMPGVNFGHQKEHYKHVLVLLLGKLLAFFSIIGIFLQPRLTLKYPHDDLRTMFPGLQVAIDYSVRSHVMVYGGVE